MNTVSEMLFYLWMVFSRYIGATILSSFLFMFFFMYVEQLGLRKTIQVCLMRIKKDRYYRLVLILAVCVFFILYNTVFCRRMIENPLANIIGKSVLIDSNGKVNTDGISNILLFIPYGGSLYYYLYAGLSQKDKGIALKLIYKVVKESVIFSFVVEVIQLVFSIGTFQISDICYNAIGGLFGGIIFMIVNILKINWVKRCKTNEK